MTEKEHLEQIARICCEIGDDLMHIKRLIADLQAIYGIMICGIEAQSGCSVQVYAGIDLLERALSVKAKETKKDESLFGNSYKVICEHGVEWFQAAKSIQTHYLEANHNGRAVIDLRTGRAKE